MCQTSPAWLARTSIPVSWQQAPFPEATTRADTAPVTRSDRTTRPD
jgi:hypothetical protein